MHRSLDEKKLRPYERREFVLPAGRDITGDLVEQVSVIEAEQVRSAFGGRNFPDLYNNKT